MQDDRKNMYINIVLGIITTYGILFNYVLIYKNGIIQSIGKLLNVTPIIAAIILIAITLFYFKYNRRTHKTNLLQKIVSLFFALVMIFGKSFEETNSIDLIFKSKSTLLVSIIGIVGYFILFKVIFQFLNYILTKINIEKSESLINNKAVKIFDNKPFLISLIIIITFWLIYLIAFYPGIVTPDAAQQILQAFNIHTMYSDTVIQIDANVNITNHHPVLHTWILGICMRLGKLILNDNFGIFICTLTQFILLSTTLAYTIKYMKKIGISYRIRFIVLLIYCLIPIFPFYAITVVKDTVYTSLMIIYVIQLYDYIKYYKDKKISHKKLITFLILILLISLFRNNGIYVVVLSFIGAVFYTKKNFTKMISILIIGIVLFKSFTEILLPYLRIPDTSIRETLSIPFQQTARYVKYYEQDLTQKDKEVIDKILVYDDLAKRYNPVNSDNVKNKYNKYATKEDLKEYFNVWFKCLWIHPNCYIQSFLNNYYGYFYPSNKKGYVYTNKTETLNKYGNMDYHFNSLQQLRDIAYYYQKGFREIPAIGLIVNIGFNTGIVIIISTFLIINKNKRKYLIVMLPHLISILICMASPVNNYYRYAMPYIFAMPVTMILFIKEITNIKGEKNGEK